MRIKYKKVLAAVISATMIWTSGSYGAQITARAAEVSGEDNAGETWAAVSEDPAEGETLMPPESIGMTPSDGEETPPPEGDTPPSENDGRLEDLFTDGTRTSPEVEMQFGGAMALDEVTAENAEASVAIDGTIAYYATIEEAFAAANERTAVITLHKDIMYTGEDSVLDITGGEVTLDFGNQILTEDGFKGNQGIVHVSGGTLTVKAGANGGMKTNKYMLICEENGKLIIDGGTFTAIAQNGFNALGCVENSGGTVIINDGFFYGDEASQTINHFSGNTIINKAVVTGNQHGMYYYRDGNLTLNGGTFSKIEVDSSCLKKVRDFLGSGKSYKNQDGIIEDSSILDGKELTDVEVVGGAVDIITQPSDIQTKYGYDNSNAPSLIIEAGKTDSDTGDVINYQWYSVQTGIDGEDEAIDGATAAVYTIPEGKSVGEYKYYCKVTCGEYIIVSQTVTLTITEAVPNCSHETANEDGVCTICGRQLYASVQVEGVTRYFVDIHDAFTMADGKTAVITIIRDVGEIASPLKVTGGIVTLDLNGRTLTGVDNVSEIINVSGGILTVNGTNGKICAEKAAIICGEGAEVILNGGTIFTKTKGVVNSGGTVIVNQGEFPSEIRGLGGSIYHESGNTTINDLIIKDTQTGVYYSGKGNLILNGGKFSKITIDDRVIKSVKSLLGPNKGYKDSNNWIIDPAMLGGKTLADVEVADTFVNITKDPAIYETFAYGNEKVLSCMAVPVIEGDTVTYQWYRVGTGANGTDEPINGATNSEFQLPRMEPGQYKYYCIATCKGCPARSRTSTVTVNYAEIQMDLSAGDNEKIDWSNIYYGTTVPLQVTVTTTVEIDEGKVELFVDDKLIGEEPIEQGKAKIPLDTYKLGLKPGNYKVKAAYTNDKNSINVSKTVEVEMKTVFDNFKGSSLEPGNAAGWHLKQPKINAKDSFQVAFRCDENAQWTDSLEPFTDKDFWEGEITWYTRNWRDEGWKWNGSIMENTENVKLDTVPPKINPDKITLQINDTSIYVEIGECVEEGSGLDYYKVNLEQDGGFQSFSSEGENPVLITGLQPDTEYTFYVFAIDKAGWIPSQQEAIKLTARTKTAAAKAEINLDTLKNAIHLKENYGQNCYSLDSGQSWTPYSTSVTLTGQGPGVLVESGRHNVILNGAEFTQAPDGFSALFSIQSGAAVNLTLAGNNSAVSSIDGQSGIGVSYGAEVTIDGDGKLLAKGFGEGSGIGACSSDDQAQTGTVNIKGGNISAYGGKGGAGIGGVKPGWIINISGGTVDAGVTQAEYDGAGIGGGLVGGSGTINISGGIVNANGREGAGIGSGHKGESEISINISGGIVKATGDLGAGIGTGSWGSTVDISITGGIVTAESYSGAGIGSGSLNNGGIRHISITGGTITAESVDGAGIGTGYKSWDGKTSITGGNILASSITAPTDGNETSLSLVTITLDGMNQETAITAIAGAEDYGLQDVKTLDTNKLYLYLPQNCVPTAVHDDIEGSIPYKGILTTNGDGTRQGTFVQINEIISVDITWGDMSFTYDKGAWNTDTHTYDEVGWVPNEAGNNKISAVNRGNTDVNISCSVKVTEDSPYTVSGKFTSDSAGETVIENIRNLSKGETMYTWLWLEGNRPSKNLKDQTLGEVTVTIGGIEQ